MTERKYKYGEKTVLVSGFRVPESKVADFKEKMYALLDSYILTPNKYEPVSEEIKDDPSPKVIEENPVEIIEEAKESKPEIKTEYEYIESVPLGMNMINIIGQKLHKHYSDEIFYIRHPEKKGFNVAVLHSEKEVKDFIRKEIVK